MNVFKKRILPVFFVFCIGASIVGTCQAESIDEFVFGAKCYKEKVLPVVRPVMAIAAVGLAIYIIWLLASKNLGQSGVHGNNRGEELIKTGNLDQVRTFLGGLNKGDILFNDNAQDIFRDLTRSVDLERMKLFYFCLSDKLKEEFVREGSHSDNESGIFNRACLSGNDEMFKFLSDELRRMVYLKKDYNNFANIEKMYNNVQICAAIRHGKLDLVKWLLEEKHVVPNLDKENPVMFARENGHEDIAQYLISKGVSCTKD